MSNLESVVTTIQRLLSSAPDVVAAYLFGSVARGTAGVRSDIDVAVLLSDGLDQHELFLRGLAIGRQLEEGLMHSVDLVVLNRAPPLLRFEIIRDGIVVVERDRTRRCLFQMRAMNEYYDVKRYLDEQQTATIRRIQEEGLGRGYQGHCDSLAEARRLRATFAGAATSVG